MPQSVPKSQFKPHALEYFRKIGQTAGELATKDDQLRKYPHVKTIW